MKIAIVNGPNLNLLGRRNQEVYGYQSFEDFFELLKKKFQQITFDYFQTNIEGELINKLHEIGFNYDGIILNAGGYTHTSVSIGDAVEAIKTPVVEVHISNTFAREDFRHQSYISKHAKGVVVGFGLKSYELGVVSLLGGDI